MINIQRFDEHIKEQFNNYSPIVHPRIWENIAAQNKKRRPAGFWFTFFNNRKLLAVLGILILTGSSALLMIQKSTGVNNQKNIDQASSFKSPNHTPADLVEDKNIPAIEKNSATSSKEILINNTTNISSTLDNKVSASPVSKVNIQSPFYDADVKDVPSAFTKKSGNTNDRFNMQITNGTLAEDNDEVYDINKNDLPPGGTLLNRLMYGAEKIAAGKKSGGKLLLPNPPFNFLPGCPALEKNTAGNKKYLDFYAGLDYAISSYKDTGNTVYLQKRKESTKFTSAYSAGLRYTKVFNNSMSVRAGINYSQINEKFTYVQGNLVQVTYIIDVNGDTTGSYITTGKRYKTTNNKYRSIDIPLTIGYEIGNDKIHANINAGAVINIYSWQKGEVLDTAYQPVNITTGKGSSPYQYKTNAGIGFTCAVSVYYKLNEKIHLMAEPYYRHNFTQMNKENLTLKQKYNTIGLRLGIRVDLH